MPPTSLIPRLYLQLVQANDMCTKFIKMLMKRERARDEAITCTSEKNN
jgi:hypothetical protein